MNSKDESPGHLPTVSSPNLGPANLFTPPEIEGYEILKAVGEGGMGVVYLARQKHPIERQVAIKVIKAGMDSKEIIARFEAERQALALLDHPNIAQVYDAGTTKDRHPFFSMEYIHGPTITDYCDQHKLNIEERLRLFIQVCEGVQHAHQKGIIHRDIKSSNVMVHTEDDSSLPKIIDFGVAKALAAPLTEQTLFTKKGQLLGTPEYMSPEQAEMNRQDIDTRSDIYSLGVLLYVLLIGALPFSRKELEKIGFTEILKTIREQVPPRPSTRLSSLGVEAELVAHSRRTQVPALIKRLHGELEWIPLKAMEKEPERRYESARALVEDINRYLNNEPILARPPSIIYRAMKLVCRYRTQAIAGSCVLFVILIASVITATLIPNELDRINEMIKANPQNAENYITRAKIYIRHGRAKECLADVEKAAGLTKEPYMATGMYRDFAWLVLCGPKIYRDYEAGLHLAEKITKLSKAWPSESWPIYNTLAMAYYRSSQWDDALIKLQESRRTNWGGNGHTYMLLCMVECRKGNKKSAKVWLNRAVEWIEAAEWNVLDNSSYPYFRDLYSEATALMKVKAKAFGRSRPLFGEEVTNITVSLGGHEHVGPVTTAMLDDNGLADDDGDGLLEHSEDPSTMWLTSKNSVQNGIEFDLDREYTLGKILVWNYNERGHTNRGIKRSDVSVWTEDAGWQRIHDDFLFAEAEGSFDYDEPVIIELDTLSAQKVRFNDLVSHGDTQFIGLSEVQIFRKRERASRPQPVDGGTFGLQATPKLCWMPGSDAVRHHLYFGNDPCNLQLLSTLNVSETQDIPSLQRCQWYYWRVDTENSDGSTVKGRTWRFSTGHLVAWYRFDKTNGDFTPDSSGSNLHGRLMGDAHIVVDSIRGHVLSLDGDGDYVDCGNDQKFDITSEVTLATWIKVGIYDKRCSAVISKSDRSWRLEKDPVRPEISFGCWNLTGNTDLSCCPEKSLDDGIWHHIVATYDGALIRFYVDGSPEVSLEATGAIGISRWKVLIGENPMWSGREWNGLIDDVRIYSYSLNGQEVKMLYETTENVSVQ